ncbi:MAG: hypothetical protein OEW15_13060 [Nitrospirota bacterium]|nr:hypothetical protein [Nitrospirota bacterium]
MGNDDQPIAGLSQEGQDIFWDEMLAKEEGMILEFNFDTKKGKVRSLADGQVYVIDDRALAQTSIELQTGDRVLIAPFEDPDGKDYAKVLRIIELNA